MDNAIRALGEVGLSVPSILLPAGGVDLNKFSVIACDQFSAQPEYWQEVKKYVGSAPSALSLTLPEAFLGQNDDERIAEINRTMSRYLSDGTLRDAGRCFVYLRRQTSGGVRKGLIAAVDLERYDYSRGAESLIRATEATVAERLPARVNIRRNAPLEMPHVMVLIDDHDNLLTGFLESCRERFPLLYDFPLMMDSGRSTGYRVDDAGDLLKIAGILGRLKAQSKDGFLFAVGDGNHSLAAAKACWEELKPALPAEERESHPARFALVEIVSLHDPALCFEPIHRLLYNVDPGAARRELGLDAAAALDAQALQPRLDSWLASHPEASLEYIHGERECLELAKADSRRLAIILPPFDRASVFEAVRKNGALVRKSFSMGEARDKRFYLECRKIK